jgi:PAS domain S-box-containing protein
MIIRSMKCSLTLMILYLSILISSGYALAEENQPNILVLNSYHQGENWTDDEISGIFSELLTQYPLLIPLVEALDTKRYPSPAHLDFLKDYLLRKYHERRIDLIIALDNPALNLITQNPTDLFPDVPVVFAGINGFRPEMIADRKKITGVIERQDVVGTLKMALAMHPKVSRILAVHDYTASGLALRKETETALAQFAGKLKISYSADVPFETLSEELKEMPHNGLVLILTYVTDKAGRIFSREESTRLITSVSPAPVYAMHETRLGFGIIGGLLLEGKEHGRQAARLAFRVLQGEDPGRIAVEESHSRSILDYEGLRRFQIPEDRWPKDALVINRPISFWSLHKNVLIPSSAAIIVLLGLSSMLLGAVIRLRHAKKTIHKSEEKYRVLFNSFPLGITVSDQDGKIVETNAISTTILGVTREEHETRKVDGGEWRIIRPDGTPMPVGEYAATRALQEKRMVENIEMGIVKPDAGITWIIVTAAPLNLENFGVVVTYLDVTARREAEEELRAREALFRTLVNTIPDLIWLKNTDGVYLSCNKKFERFFGASEADILGKTDYDFVDKEMADFFRENDRKAMAVGGPNSNEEQITFADDGHKAFLDTIKMPMFGADGKLIGVLGIGRDITERKQAEEALRESQHFNKQIIQSAKEGIIVYGPDLHYQAWNPFMEQMTGISASEVSGRYPLEVFPFLRETGVIERLEKVLAGEIVNSIEFPFCVQSTGKSGWTRDNSASFHNDKGEIVGVIGIVSDITESKRLEEKQKKLQIQLQQAQKMEAIGTLAGGIAHDFNNILGAILGYAEMAQEDSPAGSILRKDIDQIVNASHRAKDLVKQILTFSRQIKVEHISLQPALIVKEVLKMLRSSLPSTIAIQQDIDQEAGLLLADPTQIHQIMVNLCTNAFHAMEETGGILSISLKTRELTREDLASEPEVHPGWFLQLSIGDTGPGIAPEIQEKIFEPYFTTKEVGKGTGMGLAIIHGIARSYEGFVSCHSLLGEGTVFHVYLPVIADPPFLKVESSPLDLSQLGNERILLVDDEEILAEMSKVMLERLGYRVTVRKNSLEALDTFQNQPDQFDLVITDQTMPGMTGIDMARRMLQIRPGMPIILCTGYSSLISEDKVKSFGIKGFAMKPLAKKDIAVLIREVLAGGQLLS